MERIKDTILEVMQSLDKKRTSGVANNPDEWLKKILTKKELGHIKVKYFRKGTLGLSIDSSTWLYYFNLQKEGLLKKLQQQNSQLKEMRLRIGEVE